MRQLGFAHPQPCMRGMLQAARHYAEQNNMMFYEVSAKTGVNVNDMFLEIGECYVPFSLVRFSHSAATHAALFALARIFFFFFFLGSQAIAAEDGSAQASTCSARQLGCLLLKMSQEASSLCLRKTNATMLSYVHDARCSFGALSTQSSHGSLYQIVQLLVIFHPLRCGAAWALTPTSVFLKDTRVEFEQQSRRNEEMEQAEELLTELYAIHDFFFTADPAEKQVRLTKMRVTARRISVAKRNAFVASDCRTVHLWTRG
jgi:hypothetical protein